MIGRGTGPGLLYRPEWVNCATMTGLCLAPLASAAFCPCPLDHGREGLFAAFVQPQLAWVGPGLVDDGDGLGPDQARAAGGESLVAANRELVRPALGVAVAPFHRVHGQGIRDDEPAELDGLGEDRDIFDGIDRDAQLPAQSPEVLDAAQLKLPLSRLDGWLCHWTPCTSYLLIYDC